MWKQVSQNSVISDQGGECEGSQECRKWVWPEGAQEGYEKRSGVGVGF